MTAPSTTNGQFVPFEAAERAHLVRPADDRRPTPNGPSPNVPVLLDIYRAMAVARRIDLAELALVRRGEAFFHVSGAGHEASAALAPHLADDDWLACHYRDKALLVARGVPPHEFIANLLCKAGSHSAGRQMSAHISDPSRRVLSITGPVGNNALHAVGVAAALSSKGGGQIVLCAVGDGTTQEGEFLEACAEAVRMRLAVLFLVEDNRWAISTATAGRTVFSLPKGQAREFLGMPIEYVDGRDVVAAHEAFGRVVEQVRRERGPAFVVLKCARLHNHTNSDDQEIYREEDDILLARTAADPVEIFAVALQAMGVAEDELQAIEAEAAVEVAWAEALALAGEEPQAEFVATPATRSLGEAERIGQLPIANCKFEIGEDAGPLTMREAINLVLAKRLDADERVVIYGQDIEDPKGDVFGVTKGLSTRFSGRVINAPLSESTIVGASIGRALAGQRRVAMIQFADFLPLAFNQIANELATMCWRTKGGWQAPVIVMAPCGGYRPGLGPFHAQTFESLAAHVPGLDVVVPSTAADAAGLLNAAFESGRPTLFLYPKVCLNDRDRATPSGVAQAPIPLGYAKVMTFVGSASRPGVGISQIDDGAANQPELTLVSWGSTVPLCQRVAVALAEAGVSTELVDLRSIAPWDRKTVYDSARRTGRLLVVHEDNLTCGFGAEVAAAVCESASRPIAVRRVARPDTHIPCNYANQLEVLPSLRRILEAGAELLDLEVVWGPDCDAAAPTTDDQTTDTQTPGDLWVVDAQGSSPADQVVTVVEWLVACGEKVEAGQPLAEVEADKAVSVLTSPVTGEVEAILATQSETVRIGTPLVRLRAAGARTRRKQFGEQAAVLRLQRRGVVERGALAALAPCSPGDSSDPICCAGAPASAPCLFDVRSQEVPGGGVGLPAPSTAAGPATKSRILENLATDNAYRDMTIAPRQRLLNERLAQSAQKVAQGTLTKPLDWMAVVQATQHVRSQHADLPLAEFDIVAWAVARATARHPRSRAKLVSADTRREYAHVSLGVAVHLPDGELSAAVVPQADQLGLAEFTRELQQRIGLALAGETPAVADALIMITHLSGFGATDAVPVLVAPTAGVLFLGAPFATPVGTRVNLVLAFDHRLVNGVGAAEFLRSIGEEIDLLEAGEHGSLIEARRVGTAHDEEFAVECQSIKEPDGCALSTGERVTKGELLDRLKASPSVGRQSLLEVEICREAGGLVRTHSTFATNDNLHSSDQRSRAIVPNQPMRNQGLDSLGATALTLRLERLLGRRLPQTLVWNYPTAAALASHLLESLQLAPTGSTHGPAVAPIDHFEPARLALLEEIAHIAPNDAAALLACFAVASNVIDDHHRLNAQRQMYFQQGG